MILSRHIVCLILTLCTVTVLAGKEDPSEKKEIVQDESGGEEEQTCSDQHGCLALELEKWLSDIQDKKFQASCDAAAASNPSVEGEPVAAPPLYKIVSCNDKGAVWQFKYAGGKGKKRIFHGKGKLTFSKLSSPPYGYDYGMKSGVCLLFAEPEAVASVEGNFVAGIPNGDVVVGYFDGRAVRAKFENGVIDGFARTFVTDINPETNTARPEKKIQSTGFYTKGKESGPKWTYLEGDIKTLSTGNGGSETLALIPIGNETKYFVGHMEEDDMMSGVHEVKILSLTERNCQKVVEYQLSLIHI